MRIVEKTIFKFEELDAKAQAKAIEGHRYMNVEDYDWWDSVYDASTEMLEREGFTDIKINFSGFYSQGDGASFECIVDLPKFIQHLADFSTNSPKLTKRHKRLLTLDKHDALGTCSIVRTTHQYCHENSCMICFNAYDNILESEVEELEREIQRAYVDGCIRIYTTLQAEYESLIAVDTIKECLTDGPWEFCEDGTPFNGCM